LKIVEHKGRNAECQEPILTQSNCREVQTLNRNT